MNMPLENICILNVLMATTPSPISNSTLTSHTQTTDRPTLMLSISSLFQSLKFLSKLSYLGLFQSSHITTTPFPISNSTLTSHTQTTDLPTLILSVSSLFQSLKFLSKLSYLGLSQSSLIGCCANWGKVNCLPHALPSYRSEERRVGKEC